MDTKKVAVSVLSILVLLYFLVSFGDLTLTGQNKNMPNRAHTSTPIIGKNRTIYILWYKMHAYFSIIPMSKCAYSNCVLTKDKSMLNISDAVLFGYDPKNKNKPKKKKGQIWIIVHIESPVNNRKLNKIWDGALDWSMTYRKDSEIFLNYSVFNRTVPLEKDYHKIYKNKTKSVAWAVSHCFTVSGRSKYVRELKKYIDIDIYGRCRKGTECPGKTMPECHEALSQNYRFYLAFENSLCKDYATEKIYHTFLDKSNAIYITRGAPNIKSLLPPKTFIDTRDFSSPKDLAIYLNYLGSNENEYISYLKEIDKYYIREGFYNDAMCNLCEILNTKNIQQFHFTGRNFNSFYRQDACERPRDI